MEAEFADGEWVGTPASIAQSEWAVMKFESVTTFSMSFASDTSQLPDLVVAHYCADRVFAPYRSTPSVRENGCVTSATIKWEGQARELVIIG